MISSPRKTRRIQGKKQTVRYNEVSVLSSFIFSLGIKRVSVKRALTAYSLCGRGMRNMGSARAMPSGALAGGGHARVLDLRGGQCNCNF